MIGAHPLLAVDMTSAMYEAERCDENLAAIAVAGSRLKFFHLQGLRSAAISWHAGPITGRRNVALTLITCVLITLIVVLLRWLHHLDDLPECAQVTRVNGIYQEPCIIHLGPD